ncbi:atp3 gamma subunit of the F1 sector of mitochondrial F1F0 ATP synthase [Dimargaris cristalligena]|nr:atp3 gamma subunit of the F1 sector of mitochondrial F1F0 ATP synthase [Dimargaris cristalligena]
MSSALTTGRSLMAAIPQASVNAQQARNMATLREVQMRLKSISNISKITKSMKMISSTKMARAQKSMTQARQWGLTSQAFVDNAEVAPDAAQKTLYLTVSSDSGLCGGIHSSVSKRTKKALAEDPEAGLMIIGDKAKAQLQRVYRDRISMSFSQVGKNVPSFAESCAITDCIQAQNTEFDQINIVYNHFNSVISYESRIIPVYTESALVSASKFSAYEVEDDTLSNLQEFLMANSIHWALVEGHASEMAAKRTAMENATKNATDMIDRLTMIYNRGRQAVITNELVEIITGASAL